MKTFYFDCETTGTDPNKNALIQIACLMEIDGNIVDELNLKIKPMDGDIITPEAMEVNNITIEDMKKFEEPQMAHDQLISFFDKHINKFDKTDKAYPAGYNAKFDLDFLNAFTKKCGNKYGLGSYLNWKLIDPINVLRIMDYVGTLSLENYKLATACEHFNIKLDQAHDAMSDIKATRELTKIILNKVF